jgi:ethanolamine kinase
VSRGGATVTADPAVVAPLQVDAEAPDRDDQALAAVRALVPGWEEVREAAVEPLTGGITNLLLRVSADDESGVLVRVYGPRTEVVIDRERENRTFARLAREGLAPPYLGRFENGRCEGFLPGFRALEPHELGEAPHRRGIARELARLHALAPDPPQPRTFSTLRGWLDAAAGALDRLPEERQELAQSLELSTVQQERLDALERALRDGLPPTSTAGGAAALRPVLAHNDLLSGNILVRAEEGGPPEIRFIDFEYGDTGFAGFDLANHVCEYAGFDSDFAAGFPEEGVRHDLIAHYLGAEASGGTVRDFDALLRFFVMVDHLWWGSWAVVQAAWSPIDFDFLDYARLRFAGFDFHEAQWGPLGQG